MWVQGRVWGSTRPGSPDTQVGVEDGVGHAPSVPFGGQEIHGKPKKSTITRVDHVRRALLANPFYYGVFVHKGEVHQGIHVPMITKQTFDDPKSSSCGWKPRHGRRHGKGFLFLNFARCGSCAYAITAERHIKKSGLRFL